MGRKEKSEEESRKRKWRDRCRKIADERERDMGELNTREKSHFLLEKGKILFLFLSYPDTSK